MQTTVVAGAAAREAKVGSRLLHKVPLTAVLAIVNHAPEVTWNRLRHMHTHTHTPHSHALCVFSLLFFYKTHTRTFPSTPKQRSFLSAHLPHFILFSIMRSKFKDEHPFEKRKAEAERIRQKYPDRIPVICEKVEKSDVPTIDKKKYLVPSDLTVGQFVYVIRKRIKLSPEKAIFLFVNEILPPTAGLMSAIYEEHKDDDGFLYISYSGENTFGAF